MDILQVNNLVVNFKVNNKYLKAIDNISFSVAKGEILGIVGESGSGKSQTVLAIMGLLAHNATVGGSVKFLNQELIGLKNKEFNKIRGNKLAIVFQDPMTSLNPYLTIQTQMSEVLILHKNYTKAQALKKSIEMLDFVKIPEAKKRIKLYPHEFSGGMRQRVMIAMALLCEPELLIADEPTTALDVTIQAQILDIISNLKKEFNMSVIMITHDMGVVANICDRVNVMYAGQIMESGSVNSIFDNPLHPYTTALLKSTLGLEEKSERLVTIPGEPPNLLDLPSGCVFQERCALVKDECKQNIILEHKTADNKSVKCILHSKNKV
jgi:oligopeptide transport system ATP-binding protein